MSGCIPVSEREELLRKCWLSHDALWLYGVVERFGPEAANDLNKRTARTIGQTEMRRLMRLAGVSEVRRHEDYHRLFRLAEGLFVPSTSFAYARESLDDDSERWTVQRCFAYEGLSRMGLLDRIECAIWERVEGWLDAMGVSYEINPPLAGCYRLLGQECQRSIVVEVKAGASGGPPC